MSEQDPGTPAGAGEVPSATGQESASPTNEAPDYGRILAEQSREIAKLRKKLSAMSPANEQVEGEEKRQESLSPAPRERGEGARLERKIALFEAFDGFELNRDQRSFLRDLAEARRIPAEDVAEFVAEQVKRVRDIWGVPVNANSQPKQTHPAPTVSPPPTRTGPMLSDNPETWDDVTTAGMSSQDIMARWKARKATSGKFQNLAAARKQKR